ncbi:hypothetical protein J2S76_000193 [Ancylobacter vacuolatus]|uniref:Uncharacterized protein n=1 Tax=Ancylobacter vacuolatus TaxID=223389 RepID=A0ABU0DBP3_9HYPH|nr:hypothetical protein [Ancylobacter vacuolatus]
MVTLSLSHRDPVVCPLIAQRHQIGEPLLQIGEHPYGQ